MVGVKPQVSLLCHTLSGNAFGRAWVLAELLKRDFDVHVVAACRPGDQVWAPVRESCDFEIRRYEAWSYPGFQLRARQISRELVTGRLIYAVKPRLASFGLALAARRVEPRPLLLDIDDWEVGFSPLWQDTVFAPWALLSSASGLHTRRLSARTDEADAITVSSSFLHRLYGGSWIPHARDESAFDGGSLSVRLDRAPRTVVFIGTPRKHKGLGGLLQAFQHVSADARLRIVGGALDKTLVQQAEQLGDRRISVEPPVPMAELPALLASADLVVIPQDRSQVSEAQLPAKLLDAMAMGRAILSTKVGDIPRWLEHGAGVVVEPGDPRALGVAIDQLVRQPEELRRLGERARARFLELGSVEKLRPRLVQLVEQLLAGHRPVPLPPFGGALP
ncbi:MAG: glycosyltransferase [Myxococcaceae bacterium]|nr:glycosyltransferase [Myxococcaceae bacterium]